MNSISGILRIFSRDPGQSQKNKVQGGYEKQIRSLFEEHYDALCQLVFRIVGDRDAAEDIVQGVFSRVWAKRTELDWEDRITHYLYRSARNNAIDWLRKQRPKSELDEPMLDQLASEETADEDLREAMQLKLVQEAMELLPSRCKEVFTLQKLSGMTYREIAEELDISVKTVENQMVKALSIIRDHYQKNRHRYGL